MKEAFAGFVRELQGNVRARRQEKIREVELAWSASELAAFRLFALGLHSAEMARVCHALSDAQAIPLLEILGDFAEKNSDLMKIAFQSMEKTSAQARIFLAKRLIESKNPQVRARTCEMLGNSGPPAEPLLERAFSDGDAEVQQAAINAVSRGSFKKLGSKIFPLLRSGNGNVRFAALKAVVSLGVETPGLNDDVLAILRDSSEDAQTRRLAAAILARSSCRRGRAVLLAALRDPGAEDVLRVAGAESLIGYGDSEALKAVLRAVDDREADVAKTARMSFSRKNSQAFADMLAQILGDADTRIAELAAEVLGGLDGRLVGGLLLARLKAEKRIPVLGALAQALSKGGIPGTWEALIARQREEHIASPAFFSALADVADEDNLPEFASFFDKVKDTEVRRVIIERLALFARTSPVAPEIESLAVRLLNGPDEIFHISAASILAHVSNLDAKLSTRVLERLSESGDDQEAWRVAAELLRNRGGSLTSVFLDAPPAAAGLLARGATAAACAGEGVELLFRKVSHWARTGVPDAREALQSLAFLAPAALVTAMESCADQIYLLESWSRLPRQERMDNRPDFQAFFAGASPKDALAGIRILQNLQDPYSLKDVADVAFTTKDYDVREAALALTRELIFAP